MNSDYETLARCTSNLKSRSLTDRIKINLYGGAVADRIAAGSIWLRPDVLGL